MPQSEALSGLLDWYARQCDGDWEHQYGVSIETLDNPGWQMRIDVHGTALAGRAFERAETHRTEDDWLVCWVEGEQFRAACGSRNLDEALDTFLGWAA